MTDKKWSTTPARGMGELYHHLHGLSRPILLHCTPEEARKIAGADDMYDALLALADVGALESGALGDHGGIPEAQEKGRAALAKLGNQQNSLESLRAASFDTTQLEHLDDIARAAWAGDYRRTGVLSSGELRYVALASGRMRELCPNDSIAYAMDSLDPGWAEHMLKVWRADSQPQN